MTQAEAAVRVLDPDHLVARAEAAVGSTDWGPLAFRDALEVLCRSAVDESGLEGAPLAAFAGQMERHLINRLKILGDRAAYPEIASQDIKAPLIVTGLPRSGTTILHAVLSMDPGARSPLNWELNEPSPPPTADRFHDDPRLLKARAAMAQIDPALLAMHTMAADLPEECSRITELAFRSVNPNAVAPMPGYERWLLEEADMRPAYDFHRQALQHFQAFTPKDHWVLKCPPHMNWLETLLDTYPDARMVVIHRDPAKTLPSVASLVSFLRARMGTGDPVATGREVAQEWAQAIDRMMAFRAQKARPGQFFDVHHAEFARAPMEVVEAIYGHFGMALADEARAAMTAFMDENGPGKHGGHAYTPEAFGLDLPWIRKRFGAYTETYGVKLAA